jgi:signal transduction histidine kinase
VLATLARRANVPPPALSAAARERLAAHAWSGDLAELEAVLARAMLSAPADVIEAEHLALDLGPPPPLPPPGREDSDPSAPLEFLLAELAHELRNPMVTIKTYAQHLPTLLEDADLRTRFESLTGEAIERMDGLLENVLAFARLAPPRRQAVAVAPLLERVLGEVHPALAGRAVRVRHTAAPAARCTVDPDHLAFALRNLLAGVVREVPPREELALEATANGVVTLRFAAGGEAFERLRRLAAPGGAANDVLTLSDPTLLPLPFRLARAVLERNGATLAVVPEMGAATTVVIRLPTAPEGAPPPP